MHRWHSERDLMLRRWRLEIAQHESWRGRPGFRRYAWSIDYAPLPPVIGDSQCHCYRGAGYFRKRHPLDCGNARCRLCHFEKFYVEKGRAEEKRKAIEFDLAATL